MEGECLAIEVGIALPVLAPIAGHGEPAGAGALDGDGRDIARAAHIGDKHQIEEGVAIHREMYASILLANPISLKHSKKKTQTP